MYSPFRLALKYIRYYCTASNGRGHGIHSPFVFDLVTEVFKHDGEFYCYAGIEDQRIAMQNMHEKLEIADLGAGSRKGTLSRRKISSIASHALKPPKYAQLLFRLANYLGVATTVELGTSLGITTSYLACANHSGKVYTFEGVPSIAAVARENFSKFQLENITLVEGNFDITLKDTIERAGRVDLAYIDGNHREEPTLQYFETLWPHLHKGSVVIFDDIHWSAGMESAWARIKQDDRVKLTIDLFFIGLVFFSDDFKAKQDFVIRF